MISSQEQAIIFHLCKSTLENLFDHDFPDVTETKFTKDQILEHFHEWIMWWSKKRPTITNINIKPTDPSVYRNLCRIQICDEWIIGYLNQLKYMGFHDSYIAKYGYPF